jgi:hypothetical protein
MRNDWLEVTHKTWTLMLMTAAVLALLTGGSLTAGGGMGNHEELYVVPAPDAVKIDGSLDDWDLSGRVPLYVAPQTRETQSAEIGMMYDEEALYVGGTVRDSSPMMNRHDPLTDPSRAWDADVCQVFFSLDPDEKQPLNYQKYRKEDRDSSPVATMMLWYFTDRREPSLAMFQGMGFKKPLRPDLHQNGHIPAEHFDGAYTKGEDGLGYSFEYRIPWDTLSIEPVPEAEDTLAAAMAVFWSRPDGLKTAGGSAWAWNVMSKGGFPYQSTACWGTLRFSPTGGLPRELVEAEMPPEQPLPLTFQYDMPREGEATVQLFDDDNESVRILVPQQRRPQGTNTESWDGLDKDGEPLPAGEYTWRGLVHDPIEMQYRFSVHNSGNPPYPTDDNTGGWGGDHGVPTTVLALEDGMVLAWSSCEYGWGIIRVDLDGQKKWGSKRTAKYMATDGERLFFAGGHGFQGSDRVTVLDLEDSRTLNFRPAVEKLPLPENGVGEAGCTGLACDGERIYVAYGERDLIGIYDLDGNLTDRWDVETPGRLAIRPDGSLAAVSDDRVVSVDEGEVRELVNEKLGDARGLAVDEAGNMYVSQAGDLQQVRVFDPAGDLVRVVGKTGGRPARGRYDPSGMYEPGGIDIDARGRLWVAEAAGSPKRISVWDTETGENLDEYFGGSAYFAYGEIDPARPQEILTHNVLWEIDWDSYETRPKTTVWRKTAPHMIPAITASGRRRNSPQLLTADNGEQFMWGGRGGLEILMRRDDDLFKPFLAIGRVGSFPLDDDQKDGLSGRNYFWQDENDDQCVQVEELFKLPGGRRFNKVSVSLDTDLSLYLSKGYRLRPVEMTETGQPMYDFEEAEEVPVGWAPRSDGYVYTDKIGPRTSTIARRDPDTGDALWRYTGITRWKLALDLGTVGPGKLWCTTGLMGVAGDFVAYMNYRGVNHVFYTPDGTYAAALLQDKRTMTERGAYEGQPEGQRGTFVELNIDGEDRFFVIHGGQDTRVWEVMGLDSVVELAGGTYVHTEEDVATAREALEEWQAAKAGTTDLIIREGKDALDEAESVSGNVDDSRKFEARVAYDDDNLYVRYDVQTDNPLINAMPEEQILFRGGNCMDIQIATDPEADPEREEPAPGDVRLLVTRQNGDPFAVLYRPRVEGFDGERIVLESPTGEEPFDAIEVVDVGLDYEKTEEGFTATVTVPLDLIDLKLASGERITMDLGYIFGNAGGSRASARAYVYNDGFSANVTDDIPHESRLEPEEWGRAEVE